MKKLLLISALLIFACSGDDSSNDNNNNDNNNNDNIELLNCDGNPVPTIVYGTQEWTVENACHITYRYGTPIPQVINTDEWGSLTTGAWCYYDNDPTKGILYNWYAVAGIHDAASLTDPSLRKEFAPIGWHVPSDEEWITLKEHLIANGYNYDGTTTENKIGKAMASTTGWALYDGIDGAVGNNLSLNNSSGFNAYPSGSIDVQNIFAGYGLQAGFWTSTKIPLGYQGVYQQTNSFYYTLSQYNTDLKNSWNTFGSNWEVGNSVRLVRD